MVSCVSCAISSRHHMRGSSLYSSGRSRVPNMRAPAQLKAKAVREERSWGNHMKQVVGAAAAVSLLGGVLSAQTALAIPQTSTCATESCDGNDYSNKDLRKEFYTKGSVRKANFSNSNLTRVSLFGATLTGTNFTGSTADQETNARGFIFFSTLL
mmetsp:Transcript_26022/g.49151  ORF Transcript_26022/g.49151 Transcript_26022/m.49151 type:complete len:155 (-) Transcript_26022:1833-2297(-)